MEKSNQTATPKGSAVARSYEQAFADIGLQPFFAASARVQMAQMVETIARSDANINAILGTGQNVGVKAGFIAEEAHAETFNLDAILKNDTARAYTDRYEEWHHLKLDGEYLKTNDRPDIVIAQDGVVTNSAQAKYYATPETTNREMSQVKDGLPKYAGQDQLLGPSDQINPTDGVVSVREHAQAKADALRNTGGDPVSIQAYEDTAQKSTDTLTNGRSSSTPLSKANADTIGSGVKQSLEKVRSGYKTDSTMQQMGNAAVNAAALSAVVSGVTNTVIYLQQVQQGKITAKEATVKIVGEIASSAADSAIKAAANAGAQSLLIRYGTEQAATQALAKSGMQALISNGTVVSAAIGCAINAVKDMVALYQGKITKETFYERQGKGLLNTSAGIVGSTVGSSLAGAAAMTLGVAVGPVALVGGLSGGIIVGVAMNMAIENGIEKPYQALIENTENLRSATRELERVSERVFKGQILFSKYLEEEYQLERAQQNQFARISSSGTRALDAINKI